MSLTYHDDLIIDFGMHKGQDTKFYLDKGFRVVAIEANPQIVKLAQADLSPYIESGQLIIEPVGIGPVHGKIPFYVNTSNDEWSSFDPYLGTREGTTYEIIDVQCILPEEVFEKHGMPYFIKIDIEGHDVYVLRSLCKLGKRPAYLSIENSGIHCLIELYNTGARRFKFINQKEMWRIKLPNPPLEGNYVDAKFHACTSGPFGKELPGDWIGIEDAMQFFLSFVYNPPEGFFGAWWDIHVQYDQA